MSVQNTHTVVSTVWIDAPRERVWQAITETEQLKQWWTPNTWEIPALQVGATVKFHDTDTITLSATIEVVDPPRQYTIRWQPNHWYPTTELITSFLLEEENGGTRVTVTNAGFAFLPDDIRQGRIDGAEAGYQFELDNLKTYLEEA
jgi:uncharacterized protein YndB with AHSA1/START domain